MLTGIVEEIIAGLFVDALKGLYVTIKDLDIPSKNTFESPQEAKTFIKQLKTLESTVRILSGKYAGLTEIITLYFADNTVLLQEENHQQIVSDFTSYIQHFKNHSQELNSSFLRVLNESLAGRRIFLRNYKKFYPQFEKTITSPSILDKAVSEKMRRATAKEAKQDVLFLMNMREIHNFRIADYLVSAVQYGNPGLSFSKNERKLLLQNLERQKAIAELIEKTIDATLIEVTRLIWKMRSSKSQATREIIKTILSETLNIDSRKITLRARIREDFKADSLDIIEIVMKLEEAFEIEIDDDACSAISTVQDIQMCIEEIQKG